MNRNVLLEHILDVADDLQANVHVIEWLLALLQGLLSGVTETSVQTRSNTLVIAVLDSNNLKVRFTDVILVLYEILLLENII